MKGFLSRACALALLTVSSVVSAVPAQAKPTVEVAFVLDTTGSMASLIEGAKTPAPKSAWVSSPIATSATNM